MEHNVFKSIISNESMLNHIKTILLLGVLTGILLIIGSLFGQSGLTVALIFAILMNFGSLFFSHKIVLAMYRAKEVKKSENIWLHEMVEDIAKDMNIPKPKIYIVPSENPNAFATGPSKKKAIVAFTQGIIKTLNKKELKGVAAHELAHIKNRDMLVTTIAATIAAVISYIAFMARSVVVFGGLEDRDRGSGNMFALIILAILAPIAALIVQLAISRSREYLADERGARTIKDPEALASALENIHKNVKIHPMKFGSPATSSLFIVNPFSGSTLINLLSTHPPLEMRTKKLRELKV